MALKLFHRTSVPASEAILASGFEDGTETYLTTQKLSGVWLANRPLDINEGAGGDVLLEVELDLSEEALNQYECIEQGKPYREWLIPAALINEKMKVRIVDDE